MWFCYTLLLFGFTGHPMGSGGAAYPHNFDACRVAVTPKAQCTAHHDAEQELLPFRANLGEDADVQRAGQLLKPKALAQLDLSIKARDTLLDCFEHTSLDCESRLQIMQNTITHDMKMLRLALALALPPKTATPENIHVIDPNLALPSFLGAKHLPALTPEEHKKIAGYRDYLLPRLNDYHGHDESGKSLTPREFEAYCKSHQTLDCTHAEGAKFNSEVNLREQASLVATRILSDFPFLAHFGEVPPVREVLKQELEKSRSALRKWRQEVADKDDTNNLLVAFPSLLDGVLQDHPELCGSVERRYAHVQSKNALIGMGATGAELAVATGVCVMSSGLACGVVSAGLAGYGAFSSGQEYFTDLSRFRAADNNKLLTAADVKNAQTDFLISLAFAGGSAVPLVHGVAHALSTVAKDPAILASRRAVFQLLLRPKSKDIASTFDQEIAVGAQGAEAVQLGTRAVLKDLAEVGASNAQQDVTQSAMQAALGTDDSKIKPDQLGEALYESFAQLAR